MSAPHCLQRVIVGCKHRSFFQNNRRLSSAAVVRPRLHYGAAQGIYVKPIVFSLFPGNRHGSDKSSGP
ncbi:hypothetical protein ART_0843 [Arthrobacter sp. PAMC 25486]|nr:hypothetical protein ART_0843 [Arthrobacter sp. PAMC 25486]